MEGIQEVIHEFGEAAKGPSRRDFELIEIHGAHGYLVNQFLSRFSNIREDEYGGDIAGRCPICRRYRPEVRKRVGKDFPFLSRSALRSSSRTASTVEESIEILKILTPAGLDIVQVSAGNDATPEWICQPMFMEKACLADSAAKIKKALDIPVMTVGRINDPLVAESIIRDGKADLVCMGRGSAR